MWYFILGEFSAFGVLLRKAKWISCCCPPHGTQPHQNLLFKENWAEIDLLNCFPPWSILIYPLFSLSSSDTTNGPRSKAARETEAGP